MGSWLPGCWARVSGREDGIPHTLIVASHLSLYAPGVTGSGWIEEQCLNMRRRITRNSGIRPNNITLCFKFAFCCFTLGRSAVNPGPTPTTSNSPSETSALELPNSLHGETYTKRMHTSVKSHMETVCIYGFNVTGL